MKALVDEDACTGCGACCETCPEVFELNDEGTADVLLDPIPPEYEQSAQEAADACPVDAIMIED